MTKALWIIVANASTARILEKQGKSLVQLELLEHPESRLHNRDLVSDKPGRDFESIGSARHSYEAEYSPHELEVLRFAKEICQFLSRAKQAGKFDSLYIAASPTMLGLIRSNLDKETSKVIKEEVDRDLTQLPVEELVQQFEFSYL